MLGGLGQPGTPWRWSPPTGHTWGLVWTPWDQTKPFQGTQPLWAGCLCGPGCQGAGAQRARGDHAVVTQLPVYRARQTASDGHPHAASGRPPTTSRCAGRTVPGSAARRLTGRWGERPGWPVSGPRVPPGSLGTGHRSGGHCPGRGLRTSSLGGPRPAGRCTRGLRASAEPFPRPWGPAPTPGGDLPGRAEEPNPHGGPGSEAGGRVAHAEQVQGGRRPVRPRSPGHTRRQHQRGPRAEAAGGAHVQGRSGQAGDWRQSRRCRPRCGPRGGPHQGSAKRRFWAPMPTQTGREQADEGWRPRPCAVCRPRPPRAVCPVSPPTPPLPRVPRPRPRAVSPEPQRLRGRPRPRGPAAHRAPSQAPSGATPSRSLCEPRGAGQFSEYVHAGRSGSVRSLRPPRPDADACSVPSAALNAPTGPRALGRTHGLPDGLTDS
ncbi:proline-rich protein 2-like [Vulpes lagopus]|uniref:proline-rich protein 2-like n=1 Tax=Vulpes lagopus TaxID=494514 RepID=UPI001BC962B8|nr:proline-rich protein 2-like [Vulpes lagopus]